jgi:hypothetical protein
MPRTLCRITYSMSHTTLLPSCFVHVLTDE